MKRTNLFEQKVPGLREAQNPFDHPPAVDANQTEGRKEENERSVARPFPSLRVSPFDFLRFFEHSQFTVVPLFVVESPTRTKETAFSSSRCWRILEALANPRKVRERKRRRIVRDGFGGK